MISLFTALLSDPPEPSTTIAIKRPISDSVHALPRLDDGVLRRGNGPAQFPPAGGDESRAFRHARSRQQIRTSTVRGNSAMSGLAVRQ